MPKTKDKNQIVTKVAIDRNGRPFALLRTEVGVREVTFARFTTKGTHGLQPCAREDVKVSASARLVASLVRQEERMQWREEGETESLWLVEIPGDECDFGFAFFTWHRI